MSIMEFVRERLGRHGMHRPPERAWVERETPPWPTEFREKAPWHQQCGITMSTPLPASIPAEIAAGAADNAWRCPLERGHAGEHQFMGQGGNVILACGYWEQGDLCRKGAGHSGPHWMRCNAAHPTEKMRDRTTPQHCLDVREHDGPIPSIDRWGPHEIRPRRRLLLPAPPLQRGPPPGAPEGRGGMAWQVDMAPSISRRVHGSTLRSASSPSWSARPNLLARSRFPIVALLPP